MTELEQFIRTRIVPMLHRHAAIRQNNKNYREAMAYRRTAHAVLAALAKWRQERP